MRQTCVGRGLLIADMLHRKIPVSYKVIVVRFDVSVSTAKRDMLDIERTLPVVREKGFIRLRP